MPLTPQQVDAIRRTCERWNIAEAALFGSQQRGDATPASDIDLLVSFHEGVRIGLIELDRLVSELEQELGRRVDVLTRRSIERSDNPYRKQAILSTAEVVYAA